VKFQAQVELLLILPGFSVRLARQILVAVLAGHADDAVVQFVFGIAIQILILRPMIGEPIISVSMSRLAYRPGARPRWKWMFGVNPRRSRACSPAQSVSCLCLRSRLVY